MNREYTEQDYYNYMRVVEDKIWKTEVMLQEYEKRKKVTKLSFEQWVQWQNNELSLDDIKI
jgi:ribonuclease I